MRIAQIAPPWISVPPKDYGGTENVIYNLVEEQVAQGHAVTLFAPDDAQTSARLVSFFARSLYEDGISWNDHLKAYYHLHKSVEYLKKHIQHFDVVHTHLSSASDLYLFPLLADVPLPHLTTLHSQFPFDRLSHNAPGEADRYYMEWIAQSPMVAISAKARQLEGEKFPLNFVSVVHHGIDVDSYVRPDVAPEDFFLWLGRIVPEKGTHLAIEAAQKAGVRLVLAGVVDENLPEAVEYFHDQIQPQIDGQQIKYIGPVDEEEKVALLNRARGMLMPILWEEPFGMVIVEAMAAGCPVISFRRGAVPEIITSEQVGLLVEDVAGMVECIQHIDTIERSVVRAYCKEHFSVQRMTGRYLQLYEQIAGKRKNRVVPLLPALYLDEASSSVVGSGD